MLWTSFVVQKAARLVDYALNVTRNPVDRKAAARAAYIALKFVFRLLNSAETPDWLHAKIKALVARVKALDRSYGYRAEDRYWHWRVFHQYWEGDSPDKVYDAVVAEAKRLIVAYLRLVVKGRTEFINAVKLILRMLDYADILRRSRRTVDLANAVNSVLWAVCYYDMNDVAKQRAWRLYLEARKTLAHISYKIGLPRDCEAELRRAYNEYMREYMRDYRRNGPRNGRMRYKNARLK